MPASVQSYVGSKGAAGGCRKATFMQRHRVKVAFLRARVSRRAQRRAVRWVMAAGDSVQAFYAARGFLFAHRDDYDTAYRDFRWPELDTFNWALDHIDAVAADPVRGARRALWIVEQDGSEAYWTFAELAARSNRVANRLREWGVRRGGRRAPGPRPRRRRGRAPS